RATHDGRSRRPRPDVAIAKADGAARDALPVRGTRRDQGFSASPRGESNSGPTHYEPGLRRTYVRPRTETAGLPIGRTMPVFPERLRPSDARAISQSRRFTASSHVKSWKLRWR